MVVDFPDPFGPRKPWTSPVSTSRSSPSRARTWPNVFTNPETAMALDMPATYRPFTKL
jgi:hypothetical protein